LQSFPYFEENYLEIRELSSDMYLAILTNSRALASVVLLNTKNGEVREVIEPIFIEYNHISFSEWSNGISIEVLLSPGEAVGDRHGYYINESGEIAAHMIVGSFQNIDSQTMVARIGDDEFHARLVQKGSCPTDVLEEGSGLTIDRATTTLTGISVDGKNYLLPTEIAIYCDFAYGGGYWDPEFPYPSFDGVNITFRLPGYDAYLTPNGVVQFEQKTSYSIPCVLYSEYPKINIPLIREDEAGSHKVLEDVKHDPELRGFDFSKYCLEFEDFDGEIVYFKVLKYDSSYGRQDNFRKAVGNVELIPGIHFFQNLRIFE